MSSKAVENGKINYLSASSIATASPLEGGCPRKWWYQYVGGLRSPQTKAQARGEAVHKEIELYLDSRGQTPLRTVALRPWLDELLRNPDVTFAQELDLPPEATILDDIRLKGRIDLLISGLDGLPTKVVDWKTTGRITSAKSSDEVLYSIQGSIYAHVTKAPELFFCYLDMSSSLTPPMWRGGSTKRCRPISDIEESIACLPAAAAATDPSTIPHNNASCDAWGGCPAKGVCSAYTSANSGTVTGRQAQQLIRIIAKSKAQKTTDPEDSTMSAGYFDIEESTAPAAASNADLIVHWLRQIESLGIGMPALGGECVDAWTAATGAQREGHGLAGAGKLGRFAMRTWDIEGEGTDAGRTSLKALVAQLQSNPAYASRMNDYVPQPAPLPAAGTQTTEPPATATVEETTPAVVVEAPKKSRSRRQKYDGVPEAVVAMPDLAAQAADMAAEHKQMLVTPDLAQATQDSLDAIYAAASRREAAIREEGPTSKVTVAPAEASAQRTLYVDCLPATGSVENLAPWVATLADWLRTTYGAIHGGDSKAVAYGAWRERIAEAVKISPPDARTAYATASDDPVSQQIVNSYCDYLLVSGGLVVRSTK